MCSVLKMDHQLLKWKEVIWWWILFGILIQEISGLLDIEKSENVEIIKLSVPNSIENGTVKELILDCEYKLKDNLTDLLVVSWYYNDHKIVYQWILSHNIRRFEGILKNRTDHNYSPSSIPWEKYRAIKILNPTVEISGKYSCDVQTLYGDKQEGANLTVFTKPTEYDINITQSSIGGYINVSCWAFGAYPEPKLTITYEKDQNQIKLTELIEENSQSSGGSWDVWTHIQVSKTIIPSPSIFSCDIKIPNTSFLVRKQIVYSGEEDEYSSSTCLFNSHPSNFYMKFLMYLLITIYF